MEIGFGKGMDKGIGVNKKEMAPAKNIGKKSFKKI